MVARILPKGCLVTTLTTVALFVKVGAACADTRPADRAVKLPMATAAVTVRASQRRVGPICAMIPASTQRNGSAADTYQAGSRFTPPARLVVFAAQDRVGIGDDRRRRGASRPGTARHWRSCGGAIRPAGPRRRRRLRDQPRFRPGGGVGQGRGRNLGPR